MLINTDIQMRKLFLIIPMLFIAVSAMAQSGRLNVTVIDGETKEGVVGAIVEIVSSYDDSDVHRLRYSSSGGED